MSHPYSEAFVISSVALAVRGCSPQRPCVTPTAGDFPSHCRRRLPARVPSAVRVINRELGGEQLLPSLSERGCLQESFRGGEDRPPGTATREPLRREAPGLACAGSRKGRCQPRAPRRSG